MTGDFFYIILANLFRLYVICKFIDVFHTKKECSVILFRLAYFLFFVLTVTVYTLFHNPIYNMICNLCGIFVLSFLYHSSIKKKIILTVMIYLTNMSCDGFVYITLSNYKMGSEILEIYGILTSVIFFIVELIIERFFQEKEEFFVPTCKWLPFISIPIISGIMVLIQILDIPPHLITMIIVLAILILNVLLFYLYNSILKYYKQTLSLAMLEKQSLAYANELDLMKDAKKQNASLKHDMKHHIRMIKGFLEHKKLLDMEMYLNEIETFYYEENKQYINTGNSEIDSIINYMLFEAKNTLCNVSYKVNIPVKLHTDLMSINVILGNILENAIAAAKESQEEYLDLCINAKQGVLFIVVVNSFKGELKSHRGNLLSTKRDEKSHGIGLQNVQRIVNKNQGELNINYSKGRFEVQILWYLKN